MKFYYLFLLLFVVNSFSQNNNSSIGFIENKGQIIDQKGRKNNLVKYLLNTNGLNVQLRKNGFSYDIYEIKKSPLSKKHIKKSAPSSFIKEDSLSTSNYSTKYIYHRIDIDFENSNKNSVLIPEAKSFDYDNYYNIPNEPNGITNVHKFKKVTYKNIYNNIDVVFFIPEDKLKPVEYNFIVNKGGKISDIRLKFNGVKTELVDNKIKMQVRFGQMEETMPKSWIENGNDTNAIKINYKKLKNNVYGFESSEDLNNIKVIIDPVPVRLWGTYYGGENQERGRDITTNNNNDVYIAGTTESFNNIATIGSDQPTLVGISNIFIAKFDSNGNRLWGTYYFNDNGLNNSSPVIIKADSNDNLYLAARELYDSGIATIGAFQTIKDSFNDAILVKFNTAGIRSWATYYGGNQNDQINSLCFDSNNNVYIAGVTNSTNTFPTPGCHQPNNNSQSINFQDGFIAKFDTNGNRIWGTFYGGEGSDGFYDISISNDNYLYVSGTRNSLTNIATPGSYQSSTTITNGGMIIKFDLNGQRIWGTYIADAASVLRAVLKNNNLILSGRTFSNSIGTPGTFFPNRINPIPSGSILSANENNYLINFNVQSQQYLWGTYFFDQINKIDIDSSNNIFFSGGTGINTGLTTPDAFMPTKNNFKKSYIVKLNPLGQRIWGTYYGGDRAEDNSFLKIDTNNDIYLFGNTSSLSGITFLNTHQTSLASNPDTYLAKFRDCLSSTTTTSNTPTCVGGTIELSASGGTNYSWIGPNGFSSNLQNPIITNASTLNAGQYTCTITGTGGCDGSNTINVIVGDNIKPVPNVNPLPTITGDCNTSISTPTATDNCAGIINATTLDSLSYSLPGTYTINWTYNDGNGNIETQVQTITINPVALPIANSPQTFCIQQNATLNSIAISGSNIKWYDATTGGNLLPNSTILLDGTTYFASQTINGCESSRVSVLVNIQNTPTPTGASLQTFCSTQNPTLIDLTINGTNVIWYNSNTSTIPLSGTTNLINGGIYYASQTINGCESVNRVPITVSLINSLNANNYSEVICDNLNDGNEIINLTTYNTLLISNTSNCTFEYYNSFSGAINQSTINLITATNNYNLITGNHIIYVRIISNNGCHQIVELSLTLVNNPIISISDITPICTGNNITISAGLGFDTYSWSTGESSQSIVINQEGNYSVTVTKNNFGTICSTTKNFEVVLSNIATISNIETIDWTNNENIITVNIDSNSLGDYEYSLDGIHYQDSNVFNSLFSGQYSVYVRDKNGCGIVKKDIYLFSYPKYFTPNSDGINDIWKINFSEKEPTINIKIFDRFNKLLKNTSDNGWDGTYNGQLMPSDDYWFVITRANGKEYKGHFTLKR